MKKRRGLSQSSGSRGDSRGARRRLWAGVRQHVWLLVLVILAGSGVAAQAAQEDPRPVLEELHYRVDVLMWRDAARVTLTLKSLGEGRYQAEISGVPQGMLKALSGERQDSYRTEMVCRQGRLVPVVYREESRRRGRHFLKEYRFDYDRGKLEMWQLKEGQGMVRKWQTALHRAIYDPLSAFYNCRLGLLGPIRDGQVFKVAGIPYPKPEVIEVRIGPETAAGRKTMILLGNQAHRNKAVPPVFAFLDGQSIPQTAWTSIWGFGKISGELLPGGKSLTSRLPELRATNAKAAAGG